MFNPKTKPAELSTGSATIIGAGTTIKGDIFCDSDIRIDGKLLGNLVSSAKIVIGASGVVEGNITGNQADLLGKVLGQVKINELLLLRGNCNVQGDIFAGQLQVEPSATFNGHCHMGANVVELNAENNLAVNQ